ncbi:MAG TPA: ATP-binding protein [Verrucomicrobiae bacterium]|nr:ATP-binding protein [Verrucomicrobiae bacterium]
MQEEKVNILLVDDQPGKLIAHEAILQELGQNVIKAMNGREALECLLKQDFAVILLDVNMPGMDGFETAELIRQRPRFEKTPIIFITAYNTTDIDRLKGYRLGAVDYMFLPVIADVLKAKVSVFVELARQTQVIKRQADRLAFHNEEQARKLDLIQQLNVELREANEQLETFSYSVSHDLRAPLRSLQGFSEVLLEDYSDKLDEEARTYLERIKSATVQMEQLTRDLLQYCRVTREDMTAQPIAVDVLLKDVLSMQNFTLPPRGQLIVREGLDRVMANPTLLGQCLSNLVNNAFKFAAPNVPPRVEVWTERDEKRVRINVKDNGIGIDPAHHEKVFGLFERVGNVKEHDGTGIGLAIVARAAQRMGGKCGVDSKLGGGSRFWIELPAAA